MGKPVQNGIGEQSSKVLVSLEDFTSLRGDELLQSIYFVVIGYNLDMHVASNGAIDIGSLNTAVRREARKITNARQFTKQYPLPDEKVIEIFTRDFMKEFTKNIDMLEPNGDKPKSRTYKLLPENLIVKHMIDSEESSHHIIESEISTYAIKSAVDKTEEIASQHSKKNDPILSESEAEVTIKNIEQFSLLASQEIAKEVAKFAVNKRAQLVLNHGWRFGMPTDADQLKLNNDPIQTTIEEGGNGKIITNKADDFFFAWSSPIFHVQRGRQHQFSDGYPLFYGVPNRQASIYIAALDAGPVNPKEFKPLKAEPALATNEKYLEPAITAFHELYFEISNMLNTERKKLTYLAERERKISQNFDKVKKSFSLLIKEFEARVLKMDHEIRYTNVFTFKENDEWLEGGHQDWGDHRMAMTIKVEVS